MPQSQVIHNRNGWASNGQNFVCVWILTLTAYTILLHIFLTSFSFVSASYFSATHCPPSNSIQLNETSNNPELDPVGEGTLTEARVVEVTAPLAQPRPRPPEVPTGTTITPTLSLPIILNNSQPAETLSAPLPFTRQFRPFPSKEVCTALAKMLWF